jgi:HNH endonuclease
VSKTYISASLRRLVEERENLKCEYCVLSANLSFYHHEIDHVIAEKHQGKTVADNVPIERRLAIFATAPANFASPLQSGCYAAIATPPISIP